MRDPDQVAAVIRYQRPEASEESYAKRDESILEIMAMVSALHIKRVFDLDALGLMAATANAAADAA